MGVLGEAFRRATGRGEQRRSGGDLPLSWDGFTTSAWADVHGDSALRIIAVYAAVSQIADSLAGLSIRTQRRERGRWVEIDPPKWMDQPDDRVSDFDWIHQALTSVLLRGNAYGLAFRDDYGLCTEVEWQHPSWVSVDDSSGWLPRYSVRGKTFFSERTRPGGGLVHIPGFILPGTVEGLSPVGLFRNWFEMSRNATETAREWYGERAMPASILASKAELKKGQAAEMQARINAEIEPGRIMVVDGANWGWTPVSLSPSDMLFLDTIEATATQIAAIYRTEPEDVGGKPNNSLKYSTVEGNQRKFNTRTLLAWARRFEQGLRPLLDDPVTDRLRFDLDEMARPDAEAQARITAAELNAGTLTLQEAREQRGRAPLSDADIANWLAWYRTNKSAAAESTPIADLLSDLVNKGN